MAVQYHPLSTPLRKWDSFLRLYPYFLHEIGYSPSFVPFTPTPLPIPSTVHRCPFLVLIPSFGFACSCVGLHNLHSLLFSSTVPCMPSPLACPPSTHFLLSTPSLSLNLCVTFSPSLRTHHSHRLSPTHSIRFYSPHLHSQSSLPSSSSLPIIPALLTFTPFHPSFLFLSYLSLSRLTLSWARETCAGTTIKYNDLHIKLYSSVNGRETIIWLQSCQFGES